ncbi:hypothetical protein ACOME3_008852 [Neoechinorhynchus agilis]
MQNCQGRRILKKRQPMYPWDTPATPWTRLHIDLTGSVYGKMFLLLMDATSKWPEIWNLGSRATTGSVIAKLKDCFARFGIPKQIVSENGPQFTSEQFEVFCKGQGIQHIKSSPYNPQTNGLVELMVGTFKRRTMDKIGDINQEELWAFLFNYRNSKNNVTKITPVEKLIGRRLPIFSTICIHQLMKKTPQKIRK